MLVSEERDHLARPTREGVPRHHSIERSRYGQHLLSVRHGPSLAKCRVYHVAPEPKLDRLRRCHFLSTFNGQKDVIAHAPTRTTQYTHGIVHGDTAPTTQWHPSVLTR